MSKPTDAKVEDQELDVPFVYDVRDLGDLQFYLGEEKLNPLEKMMAVELLLHEYEFIPQYKIGLPEGWKIDGRTYFLADFFLPQHNIIIETEGKVHENRVDEDRNRFNVLTSLGYRFFRFSWDDVMGNDENYDVFIFVSSLIHLDNPDQPAGRHRKATRKAITSDDEAGSAQRNGDEDGKS